MTPFLIPLLSPPHSHHAQHAYYIDYRNRRPDFIQTFLDKLVDWSAVSKRYEAAL